MDEPPPGSLARSIENLRRLCWVVEPKIDAAKLRARSPCFSSARNGLSNDRSGFDHRPETATEASRVGYSTIPGHPRAIVDNQTFGLGVRRFYQRRSSPGLPRSVSH